MIFGEGVFSRMVKSQDASYVRPSRPPERNAECRLERGIWAMTARYENFFAAGLPLGDRLRIGEPTNRKDLVVPGDAHAVNFA